MDLNAIDAAFAAYSADASPTDAARYRFFQNLYHLQQNASECVDEGCSYSVPAPDELTEMFWGGKPVFERFPVAIDAAAFVRTLQECAEHIADHAGFEDSVADALRSCTWDSLLSEDDLRLAGSAPAAFMNRFAGPLDNEACPASIMAMVFACALRVHLQGPAQAVIERLDLSKEQNSIHDKPLFCPVCGSPAAAAFVGETEGSDGRGRQLYCATCGASWIFERIRCGCCGTKGQESLHYVHVEGDEAHRLQLCDECGGHMRTVFQDQVEGRVVMEVEDVVMAPLEAVAQSKQIADLH